MEDITLLFLDSIRKKEHNIHRKRLRLEAITWISNL